MLPRYSYKYRHETERLTNKRRDVRRRRFEEQGDGGEVHAYFLFLCSLPLSFYPLGNPWLSLQPQSICISVLFVNVQKLSFHVINATKFCL